MGAGVGRRGNERGRIRRGFEGIGRQRLKRTFAVEPEMRLRPESKKPFLRSDPDRDLRETRILLRKIGVSLKNGANISRSADNEVPLRPSG